SAQGRLALSGDARLETVLPADGTYAVVLRDALYRAGAPGHFRLKVGELHYAELVFPLGVQRGTTGALELIGDESRPVKLTAEPAAAPGAGPAPLPQAPGMTGPAPAVEVSDLPEVVEAAPPAGKLQEVTVPAAINGRLAAPGEADRYRLLVQPGMALRFD